MTEVEDEPLTELEKASRDLNRAWSELIEAIKRTPEARWLLARLKLILTLGS